jgi:hypothetical protein
MEDCSILPVLSNWVRAQRAASMREPEGRKRNQKTLLAFGVMNAGMHIVNADIGDNRWTPSPHFSVQYCKQASSVVRPAPRRSRATPAGVTLSELDEGLTTFIAVCTATVTHPRSNSAQRRLRRASSRGLYTSLHVIVDSQDPAHKPVSTMDVSYLRRVSLRCDPSPLLVILRDL